MCGHMLPRFYENAKISYSVPPACTGLLNHVNYIFNYISVIKKT
jgi:ADP-heptose:LPS heptosyltransferase